MAQPLKISEIGKYIILYNTHLLTGRRAQWYRPFLICMEAVATVPSIYLTTYSVAIERKCDRTANIITNAMAADDDIDMLLDEVERRYCTPISIATPTNTTISKATMVHHHANIKPTHSAESTDYKITDDVIGNDEDLDKIISEIISDTSDGDAVTSSTRMRGRLVQKTKITDTSTYSKTLRFVCSDHHVVF